MVSRTLEWSFESFWCLQVKLCHWRRKFNWPRNHFKIEIQSVFLNLLITVTKFLFSFKKLRWSIFHFLCNFLLSKINFSWKLSSSLYSVQGIAHLNSSCWWQLWIIFPMKYSHDNCVEVLWAEIVTAMENTVHLLTCSCIKITLLKVSHNFLIKDFILLQGRPLVKQTY